MSSEPISLNFVPIKISGSIFRAARHAASQTSGSLTVGGIFPPNSTSISHPNARAIPSQIRWVEATITSSASPEKNRGFPVIKALSGMTLLLVPAWTCVIE